MDYSIQHRVQMIKIYWENQCDMIETLEQLKEVFGDQDIPVPDPDIIRLFEASFLENGSVRDEEFPISSDEAASSSSEEDEDEVVVVVVERKDFLGKNANVHHTESEDADR